MSCLKFRFRTLAGPVLGIVLIAGFAHVGNALTPAETEKAELKDCERRFCDIVIGRQPQGPDLACKLVKTWSQEDIKKGGSKSSVSWLFGDARCALDATIPRATIISALSDRRYNIRFPEQTINCKVERSKGVQPVIIRAAPKIEFKNGKVRKVLLRVKKIVGPTDVKTLIWTVTKLEKSFGIFHGSMVKGLNKFLHRKCAKVIYGKAEARARFEKAKAKSGSAAAGN